MPRDLRWKVPLIVCVIALAAYFAFPLEQRINLGLDLKGGMHLVYRVDMSELSDDEKTDAVERALRILRERVDDTGVREPVVQRQGDTRIVVQLPGVLDRERADKILVSTALLEFKLVVEDPNLLNEAIDGPVPAGYQLTEDDRGAAMLLEDKPILAGDSLVDARVDFGQFNEAVVNFTLNGEAGRVFSRVTAANIGRRLAILLDDKVQSAPVIRSQIGSQGQITGQFSQENANDLAILLRAGALPAPLIKEEERTVGPNLGSDSIQAGVRATLIGGLLVVLFMMGYYLVAGAVSVVALGLNLLFILGGMGYFHGTLTLPGIAGIVLTIGMALDANILIFERIREELQTGKALRGAVHAGYDKAFRAIVDSNVTTLIAAALLFQFGTGPIKGFAVTLTIGLLASLFTATVVTRVIFDVLIGMGWLQQLTMMQFFKQTNIQFLSRRAICFGISSVLLVIGTVAFFMRGDRAYGIDFSGGQIQEYRFAGRTVPVEELRTTLQAAGIANVAIQQVRDVGDAGTARSILVRTPEDTVDAVGAALDAMDTAYSRERVEFVGPVVGKELRSRAIWAVLSAILGILIYVGIRFKQLEFGIGGIAALFHDVIIALGCLALTQRELSITLIAGLLTIAGYSINDTIVVYDRVRENMRSMRKASMESIINSSINQMLSRTILTSATTLMAVCALYFFGGHVLNDFAFCLLIGFVVGTYSSVYIAGSLVVSWQRKQAHA